LGAKEKLSAAKVLADPLQREQKLIKGFAVSEECQTVMWFGLVKLMFDVYFELEWGKTHKFVVRRSDGQLSLWSFVQNAFSGFLIFLRMFLNCNILGKISNKMKQNILINKLLQKNFIQRLWKS
jgi:hypothetical protein